MATRVPLLGRRVASLTALRRAASPFWRAISCILLERLGLEAVAAERGPGGARGRERGRRGATGGMRVLWAAVAALGLCGLGAAAPALGAAAGGAVPASDGAEAAAAGLSQEEIEPAELAAAPAGMRAVLEKVLVRMAAMSAEIAELRAERAGVAARLRAVEVKQEEMCAEEPPEAEEATAQAGELTEAEPSRRRAQAGQACARVQDFQVLTAAAMDACCPTTGAGGGGHRRSLQASCDLPATCPSAACAAVFVPFMADCDAMLASMPGVPLNDFQSFESSCQELTAGAQLMLQPVAVQMFRVLIDTEGAAQSGSMFPGGGASAGRRGR